MKLIKKLTRLDSYLQYTTSYICFKDQFRCLHLLDIHTFERKYYVQLEKECFFYTRASEIFFYYKGETLKLEEGVVKKYWKSPYECSTLLGDHYLEGSSYDSETHRLSLALYDRESRQELWHQVYENEEYDIFGCGHFFLRDINNTYLQNIDLSTGAITWRIDFGQQRSGEILKYKHILIFTLDDNSLWGVDEHTGERLWELKNCLSRNLDQKTGLLYGYMNESYEVIDVFKGEKIVRKNFTGGREKYGLSPCAHLNTLEGNGLYFVSDFGDLPTKFGKINIHTHEIEFIQGIGATKGYIVPLDKPEFHDGRLFLLAGGGLFLYVYDEYWKE